jgi:16S rRNA (cytosine1402-N4)-methyltransferase
MHKSVLLNECLEYLKLEESNIVVDCTLGYGGHSSEILKRIKRGFLFAFDQDIDAISSSDARLKQIGNNYEIIKSNFSNLKEELAKRKIDKVDGILFDLGVSSPQLDETERGFSFHNDARLDMRMDQTSSLSAYEVVNNYSYAQLVNIFHKYGEEKYASGIANQIVKSREEKSIVTTLELVEIIKRGVPEKYKREKHPARKVFQAIRIEVNKELDVFESALRQALDLIAVNGRICVITFHSLEDRICKQVFKEISSIDKALVNLPVIPSQYEPKFKIIASIDPSEEELEENNRSRSAKLRVIERIKE